MTLGTQKRAWGIFERFRAIRAEAVLPALLTALYLPSLSGTYSLGKLVVVAVGGVWLALGALRRHRGDGAVLAYLAAVAWATVASRDPWTSCWGLFGTYQAGLLAALVLVPYWAAGDREGRGGLADGLRGAAVVLATGALAQRLGGVLLAHGPQGELYPLFAGDRAYGTVGSPIYVGALGALLLPYCRGPLETAFLAGGLWACGSRGAWLAAGAAMLYRAWPGLAPRTRRWAVLGIGAGGALALTLRPLSDLGRVAVWHAALQAFAARPLLGWGPGNYYAVAEAYRSPLWDAVYGATTQDHAHNVVLEAAATGGILGVAGLALLLAALWRATARDRTARAALVGVAIVGLHNPLPLVVKALALLVASSGAAATRGPLGATASRGARVLACNILMAVAGLFCGDRLLTRYGTLPWSRSSVAAAIALGVIRPSQGQRTVTP